MSDEFSIGDDDLEIGAEGVKPKKDKEITIDLKDVSNVEESLPEEIKEDIKKKKTKRKATSKEDLPVAEEADWRTTSLSASEIKQSKSLQDDMLGFLKEHAKIEQSSGKIQTLPTGIDVLDAILGGGFGVGTFSILAGNPGTFKTSILAQLIGTSQKKYKGKMLSVYNDSENALTKRRLYEMGVKYPPINPIQDVTVESVFRTVEALCCFKEKNEIVQTPSVVAWDSIANTVTEKEMESDNLDPAKTMGLKARILSACLPKFVSKMTDYNVSLIAINQLRDKIDMGLYPTANTLKFLGTSQTMPGGKALQYNAFHILLLTLGSDLKVEQWGFSGVKLKVKCVKNKFFTPNIPIEMIVDFNTGISNFWTNYHFLVNTKRIKPGAWGSLISYPEVKWQGTKKCEEKYLTDDKFREAFDEAVKEAIQVELIDKYTNYEQLEGLEDD
jgi:RecA/RadA recombinase